MFALLSAIFKNMTVFGDQRIKGSRMIPHEVNLLVCFLFIFIGFYNKEYLPLPKLN